jgi:hypothetical protein
MYLFSTFSFVSTVRSYASDPQFSRTDLSQFSLLSLAEGELANVTDSSEVFRCSLPRAPLIFRFSCPSGDFLRHSIWSNWFDHKVSRFRGGPCLIDVSAAAEMIAMKTGQLELFRLLAKVLILMGRIKSSSEASSQTW